MSEELTAKQLEQMDNDLIRLLPKGPIASGEFKHRAVKPEAYRLDADYAPPGGEVEHKPRSILKWRRFPMGGWVYWSSPAWMQRVDQGQDFEVPLGRHIIAPGWGKCIHHLSDGPFPNGFGSPYAVVYIGSGRFAGRLWYIGHVNDEVIPAGTHFHTGRILGRPNHSLNAGRGWTELGHAPNGYPGPFGEGARYHSLFAPYWRWSKT
jgi:murein DD-endopeptidase MepM/ murein hydrolase activator NlpD